MRDFLTIMKFEFNSVAKKKSWIITTILFALVIFGATFLLRLLPTGAPQAGPPVSDNQYYAVADEALAEQIQSMASSIKLFDSEEELVKAMREEEVDRGYVLYGADHYKEIINDGSPFGEPNKQFEALVKSLSEREFLEAQGVSFDDFEDIRNHPLQIEVESLSQNNPFRFIYTYVAIFIVYMLVIFYGNIIASSVAREKSDRTMELLITSTTPAKLLFGKVFGAGIAGLLQFVIILLAAVAGLIINLPVLGLELNMFMNIGARDITIMLTFIILGYFMYLFIYAMLGSTVSKTEEAAQATMPIMLVFVAAYIVVNSTLSTPDSLAMKLASFIPFSAPIGMVARANLATNISTIEIILSALLLVLSTLLFAFIGTMIYRLGSLNYGNRLKFFSAIKILINDRKN